MPKTVFDYDDGDLLFTVGDNMAMEMNTGKIHFTSAWENEEWQDEDEE